MPSLIILYYITFHTHTFFRIHTQNRFGHVHALATQNYNFGKRVFANLFCQTVATYSNHKPKICQFCHLSCCKFESPFYIEFSVVDSVQYSKVLTFYQISLLID